MVAAALALAFLAGGLAAFLYFASRSPEGRAGEGLPFPENVAVYDLVYNPRETLLVQQTRAAGLPAITGLGMLIEQAALAFESWTGRQAPRTAMREAVNF